MNKSEFARQVAERNNLTYQDAAYATDAVFDTLAQVIVEDEKVSLQNLGVFLRVERAAKRFRHPTTGELKVRPSVATLKFIPSPKVVEAINRL